MSNKYKTAQLDTVRVCFYARVSTQHEAQNNALDSQILWYESILREHPNWEKVNIYVDRGISATSADSRPAFVQMIEDAKLDKFDLIVTRECSRFARNTVDSLQYTRLLASYGIEVYFHNDNIWSMETDGEMRLTIMSMMSQEESHKVSDRVLSGQKTSREKHVLYGSGNILGYDLIRGIKSTENTYVINEEEAETVRRIFNLYIQGYGSKKIANIMMQEHRKTASGLSNFTVSTVMRVIKNRTYTGKISYGKSYCQDYLTHKRIAVNDESQHMYVDGDFPPIISEEVFERAQEIRRERSAKIQKNVNGRVIEMNHGIPSSQDKWKRVLRCSCNEAHYNYKKFKWRRNQDGKEFYGYSCYNQVRNRTKKYRIEHGLPYEGYCDIPAICDWKLELSLQMVLKRLWETSDSDIKKVLTLVEENYEPLKVEQEIDTERLVREKNRIEKRISNLLDMRLDNQITREDFNKKNDELNCKLEEINERLKMKEPEEEKKLCDDNIIYELQKIQDYLQKTFDLESEKVSPELVETLVERVMPYDGWLFKIFMKRETAKKNEVFDEKDYIKCDEFVIDFDSARDYRRRNGNFLRKNQWHDIKIEVYIYRIDN